MASRAGRTKSGAAAPGGAAAAKGAVAKERAAERPRRAAAPEPGRADAPARLRQTTPRVSNAAPESAPDSASPKTPAPDRAPARGVSAVDGTTRARIERAALELFAARGVDAATTREIAAAAGLSEGALYRHFASKEAIAETLFMAIHERLAGLVRAAGGRGARLEEKAAAIVSAYCQTADEDWTLFSYHLLSTARFLPAPPGADDPVAAAEAIVADAMAAGEIPKGDAAFVAAMALGVVLQPALHKAYGRLAGALSAHEPALTRGVLAVLKGAAKKERRS